ncbi:MAG: hypothetical protein RLZZ245_1608, partial [Verrucomicrobiota bacterium]
ITSASGFLSVGTGTGSTASIVNYNSDATSSFSGIALGNAANGTVYQTAGQINIATDVRLNTGLGKAGTYSLSGGTLAVTGNVNVGERGAVGTFVLSDSGNLSVTGALGIVSNTALNGTGNTTMGTFTQSGTSTVTVGSLLLTNTNNTDQAYTNTAVYNLNGGTLATASIGSNNIGTLSGGANNSIFNFAGGTLQASASTTTFMEGLTTANVKDGGVTIDTNGFDITIAQALLHFSGATTDGLTKSGNGTLTLSGANTYTGDTVVTRGTLSLGNGTTSTTLADTAGVVIGTDATAVLNLDYTGTDTVASLTINGVVKIAGVYGSSDPSGRITGAGTLTVGAGPVGGFASWITGTFANGSVAIDKRGANDDPDNDGISNLVEYAVLGEDPTVANAAVGSFSGSTKTLSFSKRLDATGITYTIEESTDLGIADAWAPVTPTENTASTISYTLPGGPAKDFLRLKVTQP